METAFNRRLFVVWLVLVGITVAISGSTSSADVHGLPAPSILVTVGAILPGSGQGPDHHAGVHGGTERASTALPSHGSLGRHHDRCTARHVLCRTGCRLIPCCWWWYWGATDITQLTWTNGGLFGAISYALALDLPYGCGRNQSTYPWPRQKTRFSAPIGSDEMAMRHSDRLVHRRLGTNPTATSSRYRAQCNSAVPGHVAQLPGLADATEDWNGRGLPPRWAGGWRSGLARRFSHAGNVLASRHACRDQDRDEHQEQDDGDHCVHLGELLPQTNGPEDPNGQRVLSSGREGGDDHLVEA